jgi:HEAT repeat protein
MNGIIRLIEALNSDSISVYLGTRSHLLSLGSAAVPHLIETMLTQHGRLGWRAAVVLSDVKDAASTPAFVQALKSPNVLTRQAAAQALGQQGDKGVIPDLLARLDDSDYLVQVWVIESLSKLGASEAVGPCLALLQRTESTTLQQTIIKALGRLGNASVAEALMPFFYSPDRHVRSRAREVYEQLIAEMPGD